VAAAAHGENGQPFLLKKAKLAQRVRSTKFDVLQLDVFKAVKGHSSQHSLENERAERK
jgi:hypothetical protein